MSLAIQLQLLSFQPKQDNKNHKYNNNIWIDEITLHNSNLILLLIYTNNPGQELG